MSNLFLDIDRAESVFKLLFAFLLDEACADEEVQEFEDVVLEIVQGIRLSDDIIAKLKKIYRAVQNEPVDLHMLASRVHRTFHDDRPVIVALVTILLRLTINDGIICKKVRERLISFLPILEMSESEFREIPDELLEVLEYAAEHFSPQKEAPLIGNLTRCYEKLGCTEESSDGELRSAYRKLVKRFHPDSHASQELDSDLQRDHRRQFDEIQDAFELISRVRQV